MFHRLTVQLAALLLLLLPAAGAVACEYCVREVGFVALHNEPYRVVIAVPEETTDEERDQMLAETRAALGPSNVVVSIGSHEDGGLFADTTDFVSGTTPAAMVHAPDGRYGVLYANTGGGAMAETTLPAAVGKLTHSPAREGLAAALIDGYATVLIVEGRNEDANRAARELAEQAIQRINAVKSGFDRVIEVGPALRVVTYEERREEHLLLWSVGIRSMSPDPEDLDMPSVAVLYGKGRRLGDVLTGNTLTDNALFTLLSYVARDCECDLDRGWLYGTTIPLVWDDALRRRAYDSLGFDPESAATRAAVARILERGPGSSGTNARDPFLEDSGTNIGIPGLTIHNLDDAASAVPPPEVADAGFNTDPAAGTNSEPATANNPDGTPPSSPAAMSRPSPLRLALIALAALVLVVAIAGGVLIAKSRGSH